MQSLEIKPGNRFRLWPSANAGAGTIASWFTVYTIVSAALTAAAKQMTRLGNLNWADALFIGLGATAILALILSATLVAIRFFRPIKSSTPKDDADSTLNTNYELPPEIGEMQTKVASIRYDVNSLFSEVQRMSAQMSAEIAQASEQSAQRAGKMAGAAADLAIMLNDANEVRKLEAGLFIEGYPGGLEIGQDKADAWVKNYALWWQALQRWIATAAKYKPEINAVITDTSSPLHTSLPETIRSSIKLPTPEIENRYCEFITRHRNWRDWEYNMEKKLRYTAKGEPTPPA